MMHTEMTEHSYIRQDAASHVLTKTTDEIKDYYTETYINGVIGEGMRCVTWSCLFNMLLTIGTIPKDFHLKFLDHGGGESKYCLF